MLSLSDLFANADERRLWKKFRQLLALPERDQSAVFHMLNGLVEARAKRGKAN